MLILVKLAHAVRVNSLDLVFQCIDVLPFVASVAYHRFQLDIWSESIVSLSTHVERPFCTKFNRLSWVEKLKPLTTFVILTSSTTIDVVGG